MNVNTVMIEELDVVIAPDEVVSFLEGVAVAFAIGAFLCGGA